MKSGDHPGILKLTFVLLGDNAEDDGVFYMSWDDFAKHFSSIDACIVPTNLGDIKLEVIEEYSVFGPLVGCLIGLLLKPLSL